MIKVAPQNFGRGRHEETLAHILEKRNAVAGAPPWRLVQSSGTHPAKPRFFGGDAMDETRRQRRGMSDIDPGPQEGRATTGKGRMDQSSEGIGRLREGRETI